VSAFLDALGALQADLDSDGRRWTFVAYDQLSDRIGPLADAEPREAGIVLVESEWKPRLRPYHKQKLLFLLASQRQFALEQARRGVAVRYRSTDQPYAAALEEEIRTLGPLPMMEPAERELRAHLASLVRGGGLRTLSHGGWLTTDEDFDESQDGPPWRMDAFYRTVRRRTGILMEEGRPAGGKFSFDAENREPWSGDPPAPAPPRFATDAITEEVAALV
jgi:deoxyribodipyrimidine photolyase-related protein